MEAALAEEREWCYRHAPTELTAVCKQLHVETKDLLLGLNEIDGNLESLEYLLTERLSERQRQSITRVRISIEDGDFLSMSHCVYELENLEPRMLTLLSILKHLRALERVIVDLEPGAAELLAQSIQAVVEQEFAKKPGENAVLVKITPAYTVDGHAQHYLEHLILASGECVCDGFEADCRGPCSWYEE